MDNSGVGVAAMQHRQVGFAFAHKAGRSVNARDRVSGAVALINRHP